MAKQTFYALRPIENNDRLMTTFHVSKFDEDLEPTGDRYTTTISKHMWPRCTCPSRKQPCKHRKWVYRLNKAFVSGKITAEEINETFFDPLANKFFSFDQDGQKQQKDF